MIKSELLNTKVIPISKNEAILLNAVNRFTVFTNEIIRRLTDWKDFTIKNTLTALKKKELIIAIKRDHYVVKEKIPENIFTIATTLTNPSYMSFWTALSYYGFTEQQVKTIQIISPKQFPNMKVLNFKIEATKFQSDRFYGYNNLRIAEKEKALIDSLAFPDKAGGIDEVKKCLVYAWPEINKRRFKSYLKRFNNKSLIYKFYELEKKLNLKTVKRWLLKIVKIITIKNRIENPTEYEMSKNKFVLEGIISQNASA